MPGIDGFEVLHQLRETQGRSELPVIMVTGRGERDHVVRALEGGANDYITKPLDLPVIVARLRTQLSLKRAYDHIVALEHKQELQNAQLERANKELENAYQQMKGDLRSAAKVQQALLPSSLPEIPGVGFTLVLPTLCRSGWRLPQCLPARRRPCRLLPARCQRPWRARGPALGHSEPNPDTGPRSTFAPASARPRK